VPAEDTDPPSTVPVVEPTEATVVLLLLHVPPLVPSVRFVGDPAHTVRVPDIVPNGVGLDIVIAVVPVHALPSVTV
jgi:hypothetical protein